MLAPSLSTLSLNTSALAAAAITNSDESKMIFDTKTSSEPMVIVPPKPDYALSHGDGGFSYSHLYCYDSSASCGAPYSALTASTSTAPTVASSINALSSSTLSSNDSNNLFDSSAFPSFNGTSTSNINSSSSAITRDPNNGAFTFSVNAEYDLLLHIQRELDRANVGALTDVESAKVIMRSVDDYCLRKQWMYHIGSEKSRAIELFLRRSVDNFLKRTRGVIDEKEQFVCVDLGTYCGYSALVLASTLRSCLPPGVKFHVYTTEVSSKLLNVAQSIFRLAKLEKYITTILISDPSKQTLSEALKTHSTPTASIDFLLLDHAKNRYLTDLTDLENEGLVRRGTYVAADNVVFNQLDAYRDHMRRLAEEENGVVETTLEEMNLEYSNNLKDGIEMTIYLKDPPRNL